MPHKPPLSLPHLPTLNLNLQQFRQSVAQNYHKHRVQSEWNRYQKPYRHCLQTLASPQDHTRALTKIFQQNLISQPTSATLLCMDEGLQELHLSKSCLSICVPGSGILLESKQTTFLQNLALYTQRLKLREITLTTHTDCGAAQLYVKQRYPQEQTSLSNQKFFSQTIQDIAAGYLQELACKLKQLTKHTSLQIHTKHLPKLKRPAFHHAYGVLLNYSDRLHVGRVEHALHLPLFVISAGLLDTETTKNNTILAYQIASGNHGFTNKFDQQNPFEIILCTDNPQGHQSAQELVAQLPTDLPLSYSFVQIQA